MEKRSLDSLLLDKKPIGRREIFLKMHEYNIKKPFLNAIGHEKFKSGLCEAYGLSYGQFKELDLYIIQGLNQGMNYYMIERSWRLSV